MQDSLLIELQLFPSLQYLSKWQGFSVILEGEEHYRKGSFRNRYHLATAQGPLALSVPLEKGKHQQLPVREVKIDYKKDWPKQHWRTIETAYGKAPFFDYYGEDLRAILESRPSHLFELNWAALQFLLEHFQLGQPSFSQQFSHQFEEGLDFRNQIRPQQQAKTQDPYLALIPYPQLFEDRLGFLPYLSALDLLFCMGPEAPYYLAQYFKIP